jgi:arginine/lysine/ornithine decarboxylase
MDQDRTPVLEAIEQYRRGDEFAFALPGHRFGRGIHERTAAVPGGAFAAVVDYLRAGLAAGMVIPDASDPKLETFRVVKD